MADYDYQLHAQYPKQTICRDRNLGGLLAWAAYTGTLPVGPDKPDEAWVRERLVAERIPINSAVYVERTINFFLMDPVTKEHIRALMSPFNDEATEVSLSGEIQNVIGAFMPRFAELDVTQAQIDSWYAQNGWPPDPPVVPMEMR